MRKPLMLLLVLLALLVFSTPPVTSQSASPALNVSGTWSGDWNNSKKESGQSTLVIIEEADGLIKGEERDKDTTYTIANGHRTGNVLTWEYRNVATGCRDYKVRLEVASDARTGELTATGTYSVDDRCRENYTGEYLNYKKAPAR